MNAFTHDLPCIKVAVIFFTILGMLGCNRYSVSINENTVYTPKKLFTQYQVADEDLRKCLADTIAEQGFTQAEQLQSVFCPPGEIRSLTGLEIFTNLRHLGLANNRISDISPLRMLTHLEQVDLSGNTITVFSALGILPSLKVLKATKNPQAVCLDLQKLAKNISVTLPSQCDDHQ